MSIEFDHMQLTPGTVIAIRHPMYKHFAIVSDRYDSNSSNNLPNLISLSYRTHGVQEEAWETVVGKHNIEKSFIKGNYSSQQILSRARSYKAKNIKYQLFTFNCEHFVRFAHGLPIESIQVKRAINGAALGAASCMLLPKLTVARFAMMTAAGAIASLKKSLDNI